MAPVNHLNRPKVSSTVDRADGPSYLLDNDLLPRQHYFTGMDTPDHVLNNPLAGLALPNAQWWFSVLTWNGGINSELGFDQYLAAGTWRMEWLRDKRADYGIVQYYVDANAVGAPFDMYAAARVRYVHRIDGIVLTRGYHRFKGVITGQNAAATGALNVFSGLILTRTA